MGFQASNAFGSQSFDVLSNGRSVSDPFVLVFSDRDPTIYDVNYPQKKRWLNLVDFKEWVLKDYSNSTGVTLANWILVATGGNISVQFVAGDDTLQVAPDPATKTISFNGNTVAAATHAKPVYFKRDSTYVEGLDVQVTRAAALSNINNAGLASFNQSRFTVDANGFVDLADTDPAVERFTVDYQPITTSPPTATGTVIPNAGTVTVAGTSNVVTEQQLVAPNNFQIRLHSPYWFEITGTSATATPNFGYICNNAALVTITLPSVIAVGQTVHICGKGTGLWSVAQVAGQTIHFGNLNTTTGTGGSLSATSQYDTVTLVCTIANTDFTRVYSSGVITVV